MIVNEGPAPLLHVLVIPEVDFHQFVSIGGDARDRTWNKDLEDPCDVHFTTSPCAKQRS